MSTLRLLPVLLALPVAACARVHYDPQRATRPYPDELHRPVSVDIQVFRDGERLEIVNSTPRSYRDCHVWINQRFVRPLEELPAGGTVQLSLWDFWDERGDRFAAGGFFRTKPPTPLRLVELECGADQPLIGLITVGGRD